MVSCLPPIDEDCLLLEFTLFVVPSNKSGEDGGGGEAENEADSEARTAAAAEAVVDVASV